uniref:AMP-dependent synthetase/ligase domain-containing protein n=1 Tax=Timema monikensis TaxID=170555 RepID=A0A7R9E0I8_9NEOP|nr:unnamed protein product [Timema monikensis]
MPLSPQLRKNHQMLPVLELFQSSVVPHSLDNDGDYRYQGLLHSSHKFASEISYHLNGNTQERVAFLCPNNASYLIAQWACWISGQIGE